MTHDQHIASDPAISAWVSASAGTGKTKVLTDRVLRLLLTGAEPSKILCITYTRAASAEMEQRIEAQLGAWAIADEDALQASLTKLTGKKPDARTVLRARQLFARVLDAPERIRIQTIHGFCQSVLIRFPLEASVAPHFTLIDEHTSRELLHEARTRLFTESRNQGDRACADAIEALATLVSETTLNELIENIINERRKFSPWFGEPSGLNRLIARIYKALGLEQGASAEGFVRRHFQYSAEEEQALRHACTALAQGTGDSDKRTYDALESWLRKREDYASYILAFVTRTNELRKVLCTRSAEKHWSPLKETLLAEQQRVFAFAGQSQSLKVAQASVHLMVIAQTLLELYRQQKAQRGFMDYDDLIVHAVALLTRAGVASWVLYKLDGGIDHLLVDEAQDTSPEQWKLVDVLASEFFAGEGARSSRRTVFIVGDEKQSIFSFQGAAPLAFDAMQLRLSKRAESSGMAFKRVRLALSFRSTGPVLQAVDAVFALASARDGLVFSEADITHELHRKGVAGRVEFWPLSETPARETPLPWHVPDKPSHSPKAEVLCANHIADTIAQWLKAKRELPSQSRPVRPGDIMILVQRRGVFADAVLRALKQKNVPVAGADRLMLTQHIAVMDCIALAEFLLLPQDDLTLAVLLKSPLIGLPEEALFELAYDRGEQSLWQRLKSNKKFEAEAAFLSSLLARVDYLPPYELFAYALETCGGRKKLGQRLGFEVEDPLNEFLSLALQYTHIHSPSLQGFVHWLRSGATEVKRDMEKGRDEVRIMTVHGAKGLQAPIVFLPDTTRLPRYDSGVLWTDTEEGIPLWSPFSGFDDRHYHALKEAQRLETDREYRRLLYVAMTRAEDELYVCGWKGSKPVSPACWYELVKQAVEAGGGWAMDADKRVLSCLQSSPAAITPQARQQNAPASLPEWINTPPADEPVLPRPLTPSRIGADGSNTLSPVRDLIARERGLLIHRLLQYLPEVAPQERAGVIQRFIRYYAASFTLQEQGAIEQEVLGILQHPDFAPVFGPDSVAEAPVSGVVQDNQGNPVVISGQIDRLAVQGGDVYIIDYKTNREVPAHESQIPKAYLRQMDAYRQLIARIYPDKAVHCALLWTAQPRLMTLSNAILESLAA